MEKRGPSKFLYPGLKLRSSEILTMAAAWKRCTEITPYRMSKVEEALIYGAATNPTQCFRVIREICRVTNNRQLAERVGIDLFAELLAHSAHKIFRKISNELAHNKSLQISIKASRVSHRDRGYHSTKKLVNRLKNA
ncbi:MAG: hypothetical protein V4812_18130 [Pseudomonadota bacterium]